MKNSFDLLMPKTVTARDARNASKTISRLCRSHAQQNPGLQGLAAAPRPSPCGSSTCSDAGIGVWKSMQDLLIPLPWQQDPTGTCSHLTPQPPNPQHQGLLKPMATCPMHGHLLPPSPAAALDPCNSPWNVQQEMCLQHRDKMGQKYSSTLIWQNPPLSHFHPWN